MAANQRFKCHLQKEWAFEMTCQNPGTDMAQHLAICKSKCTCTSVMVTLLTYSAVNDLEYGRGYGGNIKQAQNAAARDAVQALS